MTYGLKISGLAGDVIGVDIVELPADLAAAENVIMAAYRDDVTSRVHLSESEIVSYCTRHTARAMACLRRATEKGVTSYPITTLYEGDPRSYHEIQAEDGSIAKMVL